MSGARAVVAGGAAGLLRAEIVGAAIGAWHEVGPRGAVRALVVAPDDEALYAGTPDGVLRSGDGGATWQAFARNLGDISAIEVSRAAPARIVVGGADRALHVSHDRGRSWRAATWPTAAPTARVCGLACDAKHPDRIYAALDGGGVWCSDDAGRTFAPVVLDDDAGDVLAMRGIAVAGGGVLAVGRDGVLVGRDGLRFSHALDDALQIEGLHARDIEGLVEDVAHAWFADNIGVRRLQPGARGGLRVTIGARHAGAPGARRFSDDRERPAACHHAIAAVIDAGFRRHPRIAVTTHFTRFATGADFRARAGALATAACTCSELAVDHGAVLRDVAAWLPIELACRAIAVSLDAPDLVFVGAGAGDRADHGTIFRSRDGGQHFHTLALPVALDASVVALALAPSDRCRIAAVTARGQVAISLDCCTHWHVARLPPHAAPVHALAIT